jgi:hypothetical protein
MPDAGGEKFESSSADAESCRRLPSGEAFVVTLLGLPGEVPVSHREAMPSRLRVASHTVDAQFQAAHSIATYLTDRGRSGLPDLEGGEPGPGVSPDEWAMHRHNLALCRRHAARLDPLFARFEEQVRERDRVAAANPFVEPR